MKFEITNTIPLTFSSPKIKYWGISLTKYYKNYFYNSKYINGKTFNVYRFEDPVLKDGSPV